MATRQGDSEKLIKRCRDANWTIAPAGDGFRVTNPTTGLWHVVHMTYSDSRAMINVKKDIENRCGLLESEAELKKQRLANRRKIVTEGREAADRKAEAMAGRQRELITKAAGPYLTEAEEPDLEWMTSPHPSPWMRWMYITPKAAAEILDKYNTDNRKLSEDQAKKYALIILSGQWHLTHQGLAFDNRGIVQDGAHRLTGLTIAGEADPDLKVPFAVFVGMPVENFKAIDEGRLRTAAQMLKMKGVAGGAAMVTMMRLLRSLEIGNARSHAHGKLTNFEAFDMVDRDPEGFNKAIKLGNSGYKRTRISAGVLGAAYYLISKVNGPDNPYVEAFFKGLFTQRKAGTRLALDDDDPRVILQNRAWNSRARTPMEALVQVVYSWNNIARGNHPRYLRINDPLTLPDILKLVPGQGRIPRGFAGEVGNDNKESIDAA